MDKQLRLIYEEEVTPKNPYSLYWTASNYAFSWDFDGENAYLATKNEYIYAAKLSGKSKVITISYYSDDSDPEEIIRLVRHVFGLEEDLSEYYSLIAKDKILGIIPKKFNGMHIRASQSIWESAVIGICQQNASFKQGWTMVRNLRNIFGDEIIIDKHKIKLFPDRKTIIEKRELLPKAKVGYRKNAILELAKNIDKNIEIEEIRGIGKYTARIAKIMAYRDYREFPVDKWFRRIIPYFYKGKLATWSTNQVERFAEESWGAWKGLSAMLITIVTAAEPIPKIFEIKNVDPLPDKPAPLTLWRYL